MEQQMFLSLIISSMFIVTYVVAKTFYSIWWKPKRLEKYLKLQGINGTPYKLLFGDMKEFVKQIQDAWAKPASLNHQIVSRVDPFTYNLVQTYDTCIILVDRWKKLAGVQRTCEIDIWPELQALSGDIVSRTVFGSSYEEGRKILKLQKELQALVMEAVQTLYIPGFRFIPTQKKRRRRSLNKEITSMLRTLVETKDSAMADGESRSNDLLDLLLQFNKQGNLQDNVSVTDSSQMTIQEIIEECKQFYLAGHETTSSLLTWTKIVLAMHPDWQEKARDEVLQVCGKNNPSFEGISHLRNVSMILHEVQSVVALYLQTYSETTIGDVRVPAGVDLTLPMLHIHHDQELWGNDVHEFKPERFSGVAKASKDRLAFFPFGWGPRTCIGQQFATIEVKVALAVILRKFSFELSPSYTHVPHTVMTLQPQHGAQIILHQL